MSNYIYTLVPLIIPGLSFVLIALFYAILFKKRITETYFLSTATIIIVLFLTGLLNFKGSLLLGYSILLSFSLFSLIYSVRRYLKNKALIRDTWLIQGLVILSLFFCFFLFLNYRRMFLIWDEFSHWGSILKNMYLLDALGTFKETSGHVVKTYLEGSSLFQYFWMRPFTQYTEYPAYIASNLIYFSIISPFIRKYNLKNIIFLIIAFILPLLIDSVFYSTLYVDTIIGLLLGAGFVFYHYYKYEESLLGILMVIATIILLTLIKDIGFVYSIVLLIVISIDFFLFKRTFIKSIFPKNLSFIKRIKQALPILAPLAVPFVITFVWKHNIKTTIVGAEETVVTKGIELVTSNFILLINGNLPDYQLSIFTIFQNALLQKPIFFYYFSYTSLIILLVIITIMFVFFFKKKDFSPLRLIINFLLLIFGSLSSVFVVLITYLFIFSEYEALNLASFERYLLSYIISVFFAFLLFLLLKPKKTTNPKNQILLIKETINISKHLFLFVIFFLLLFSTIGSLKNNIILARNSVHSTIGARNPYTKILKIKEYVPPEKEKSVYVLTQGDNGYKKLVLIYNLIPTNMEWKKDYSVSLTQYYPELNDPWTVIITPEDWATYILENYEYVYIYNYDENYENLYGRYFDKIEEDALYEVKVNENGDMTLLRMDK